MRTRLKSFITLSTLAAAANFSTACRNDGEPILTDATDAEADSGKQPTTTKENTKTSQQADAAMTSVTSAPVRTDAGDQTRVDAARRDAARQDATVESAPDSATGGVDLVISEAIIDAYGFANIEVPAASCEIQDGCYGGSGKRTVIPFELTVTNSGTAPLEIGAPWENDNFYLSSCASQYLTTNFVKAEVLSAEGDVLATRRLPTSCIADPDSNTYSCNVQGLEAGGTSEQPNLACAGLDVTGLAAGSYTVRFTINADGRFDETDLTNNTVEVTLPEVPECDGNLCGGVCCPESAQCVDDICALPDIRANKDAVERSLTIQKKTFGENSCELAEMCITGPGKRRLLQFEGRIENAGIGDLNPGKEEGNPLFEHSECHGHFHFLDFTDYKLMAPDGSVASQGHKQAFCLVDMDPVEDYAGPIFGEVVHPQPGDTGCSFLSAGWADIYGVGTPCQWVDITDVTPGEYVLRVAVNPTGKIAESNVENNVIEVPVTIPPDASCQEEEICGDIVDQDCDGNPDQGDPDCIEQLCCGAEDACNLGNNWSCDCNGEPAWEQSDCSYYGYDEYPVPECCNDEDSCNWEHDGVCDCNGDFEWDSLDCSFANSDPCCTLSNLCGWENDDECDCDGTMPWDVNDCGGVSFPDAGNTTTGKGTGTGPSTTTPMSEAGISIEAGGQTPTTSPGDGAADGS